MLVDHLANYAGVPDDALSYLASQTVDVDFDGVAADVVVPAEDFLFELRARKHVARSGEHGFQRRPLSCRQFDLGAGHVHLASKRRDDYVAKREGRLRRPTVAADQRGDSRQQFVEVERFQHVVVRSFVEAAHAIVDGAACGDDQNGDQITYQSYRAQHFVAVALRKPKVQDDEIVRLVRERGAPHHAVLNSVDRVAGFAQRFADLGGLQRAADAYVTNSWTMSVHAFPRRRVSGCGASWLTG